jgi:hypothetical protein
MQNNYSIKSDKDFSNEIFDYAQLQDVFFKDGTFTNIDKSFGSLVQDSKGNVFFDTRIYSGKPPWGHNHPIVARYKNVDIYQLVTDFEKLTNSNDIIIKKLRAYNDIVLTKGKRLEALEFQIRDFFKNEEVDVENLTVSFSFDDMNKVSSLCSTNCLLITEENFKEETLFFDIMTAITDQQLKSCLNRIKKVYKGIRCS